MHIKQVGGQKKFKMAVVEEVLMHTMQQVMDTHGQKGIGESDKITSDINQLCSDFDPEKEFTYSIEFEEMPTLTWKTAVDDLQVAKS